MALQLNGLDPSGSGSGGGTLIGTYSTLDALAAVQVAGYFNEAASVLKWTNFLFVDASDGRALLEIDVEEGVVTTTVLVATGGGEPVTVAWDDVTDKPAVIAAGATQAAARTAIGAGTSSLALGATATTAAAGNHNHPASDGTVRGTVLRAAAQADSAAADVAALVTDFNVLLAKLRTAGVIAP